MKQINLAFYLLIVCFQFTSWAKAQEYSIGKYETLHSSILNEDRTIIVHVPSGSKNSTVHYPVMYLLDGDSHFTKSVGILDHLSTTAGNEVCPEMIVVAILHKNRERDLIPPLREAHKGQPDLFPEFLEKELFPFVEQHYPTDPYRIFVGHSLGGLRVVNTLVYQPKLFNSYVALDPSLGMVKDWINVAGGDFDKTNYSGRSLFIAMGQTMPQGMDTAIIFNDTSGNARHMRSIMTFARKAAKNTTNQLDFDWKYYPDESHQSVFFKGLFDGLSANFHWYKNEKLYDIFKPEVNAETSVKIITDYYQRISAKMGYKIIPPEKGTSELIDYLNFKKWFDKSFAFALMNYQNYPNSKNAGEQLKEARWNTKKSIAALLEKTSAKEVAKICRQDSRKYEPEYNISEVALNTIGYDLMEKNKMQDAEIIFKLYVELYPTSSNAYDSYGECLLNLNKEKEGIEAYKKSLELNPSNNNAKNILKKLGRS